MLIKELKYIIQLMKDYKSGNLVKRSNYLSEVDQEYRTCFKINDNKNKGKK